MVIIGHLRTQASHSLILLKRLFLASCVHQDVLHTMMFKTRATFRWVSPLGSTHASREHFFTNAEGRYVRSLTLKDKVKERESPESGAFFFFRVMEILILSTIRERENNRLS